MDTETMAKILVELRGNSSQEKTAKELRISKSALSMYESGKRIPRDPIKCRIAEYYNKTVTEIFFTENVHD